LEGCPYFSCDFRKEVWVELDENLVLVFNPYVGEKEEGFKGAGFGVFFFRLFFDGFFGFHFWFGVFRFGVESTIGFDERRSFVFYWLGVSESGSLFQHVWWGRTFILTPCFLAFLIRLSRMTAP